MIEDCGVHAKHDKFVNPDKTKAGFEGVVALSLKFCCTMKSKIALVETHQVTLPTKMCHWLHHKKAFGPT